MFDNTTTAGDRGQVGIETLIIFIAMILVAAIAAGILINTAGFLQNKASATSQDSTQQVSNQIIVQSAIGQVSANGTNVTALNLTVMQSPGADEIDLSEATVDWVGPHGHDTVVVNETVPIDPIYPPPCYFTGDCLIVLGVKDVDQSVPVLNTKSDRFRMSLNLQDSTTAPANLQEGEEATVKLVTQSGSSYTYVANVPESLSSSAGAAVSV